MQIWVFAVLLLSVLNEVNTSHIGSTTDDELTLVFDCTEDPIENSLESWREVLANKSSPEDTESPDDQYPTEIRVSEKLKKFIDSPERWNGTKEQVRYLRIYLRDQYRDGIYLEKGKRLSLKEALDKITENNNKFLGNLNQIPQPLLFNATSLRGVSGRFLGSLTTNDKGYYQVYSSHHYSEVNTYCHVEETRKQMYTAWANRGQSGNNSEILIELGKLRQKVASFLNYTSYEDYVTEILMAKNATNVRKFLEDLANKLKPKVLRENSEYLKVKQQKCKENNDTCSGDLQMWDYLYTINCIKKQNYTVDTNQIREYFPLKGFQDKMFRIFEGLLGLKIVEIESLPDDITRYQVNDTTTGELMGFFNLDLFPRHGKPTQPRVEPIGISCVKSDGSRQIPQAVLFVSFPKPTSTKPTLLTHGQMKILFHEFGHVVHHICSKVDVNLFVGLRVERDFVEAPSQMLENWLLEPEILKNLSSHYENKSQLSDELIRSILDAQNFALGYKTMRQLMFATFDFMMHKNETDDVDQLFRNVAKQYMNITIPEDVHFPGMFGHLAGGYAGQYYSYLWGEVYGADMFFSKFKPAGIFNSTVGREYRQKILEKGGTEDAMDLLKDFLGREPDIDAFLKVKQLE